MIKGLKKMTDSDDYTNQPYFLSEETLLFTQAVNDKNISENEQTDVFKLNLVTGEQTNLTKSSTSEYSPTPMPKQTGLSVIRVNEAGLQELWQLDFNGKPISNLLPAIEPVGYHVWLNEHELMLFVLGEPHQLVKANIKKPSSKGTVLDTNPGPSLFNIPNTRLFSYTQQPNTDNAEVWQLKIQSFVNSSTIALDSILLPDTAYYYAWSHEGDLLTSDNGALVAMDLSEKPRLFTQVKGACKTNVSRIAVSAAGKIALVCSV
ncbi:hypothetical protein [Glaciecola sp. KUL10]|uniref:hypothetical protein n=1 Tax=Glaciecola sp. (strain KUL10) TaxID=2161813 RepID=UPI000D8A6836|nr:hypothetical protein [Glaciecola sp. KUL10]GBL03482.1 hypothetical protein KUL10_07720 [Glaciecola sp. KUL10]